MWKKQRRIGTIALKAPTRKRIEVKSDVWVSSRALTLAEYLHEFEGAKEHVELVKGVPITRMAANTAQEAPFMWMARLLGDFVERRDLGVVFGSRTAVRISDYDGRLPDILFVRKERTHILEWLKLTEQPDLIIEIISPGDRASHRMELEADYRSIGVPEIVFIDMPWERVRAFRRRESDYEIEDLTSGSLRIESVPGFRVDLAWLFGEPRPLVHEILALIDANE